MPYTCAIDLSSPLVPSRDSDGTCVGHYASKVKSTGSTPACLGFYRKTSVPAEKTWMSAAVGSKRRARPAILDRPSPIALRNPSSDGRVSPARHVRVPPGRGWAAPSGGRIVMITRGKASAAALALLLWTGAALAQPPCPAGTVLAASASVPMAGTLTIAPNGGIESFAGNGIIVEVCVTCDGVPLAGVAAAEITVNSLGLVFC